MARIDSDNYDSAARGGMYITTKWFDRRVSVRVDKPGLGGGVNSANRMAFFLILDWAFVKFSFVFLPFFSPILLLSFSLSVLFWGRLAGMSDDKAVGFRRRMVFLVFFPFLPILSCMVLRCGFCFLDPSCCPRTWVRLVLQFLCFLYGLKTTELGWDWKLGLVFCCVVQTSKYVGNMGYLRLSW